MLLLKHVNLMLVLLEIKLAFGNEIIIQEVLRSINF